ncbi:probable ATP-dependent RNA helicase DDX52 [Haliotis rufescens]|uniref:probable ATP-dependent RNA helicase DDX52 n=1 Tax=Haliotis rufescens TaxID=6454 RepID=UPI00201F087B|nr:probable ATP-dependent RNA helicase DDX52 [Haliotis rufescens]
MDGYQLFRKLGFGAKFDLKRFHGDAEKIRIVGTKSDPAHGSGRKFAQEVHQRDDEVISEEDDKRSVKKRKLPQHHEHAQHDGPTVTKKQKEEEDSSSDTGSLDSDEDSDDSESGTEDEEMNVQEAGSDSESSDNKTDSEVDDDKMNSGSESDSGDELQLLGNIRSSGKTVKEVQQTQNSENRQQNKADAKQKKLNTLRKRHKIHVTGTDIPPPFTMFEELRTQYGLHKTLLSNIVSVGYKEPTAVQMQAIPTMLQRRDIMACAPTGSGKTAAFIIPILHHLKEPRNAGFRAVILAPTRELAKQTYREFQRLSEGIGFRTYYIEKAATAIKKFGPKSKKKFDILVTTPNRLVYILQKHPDVLDLGSVEWLVVDESDKLFEEGKRGFRDQLGVIYKACDSTHVRRAMFSATFACDVEEWCKLNLDNVVQVYVGLRNSATETVQQELVFVGTESGKLLAVRNLVKKGIEPPVLIFVQSKDRAKELFHELIYDGVNVDVIHADRTQLERDNVVKCFRLGKIWVLICTELMGRGIDFKGVNLVINYDFPYSAISYIHRIGRTGRAGRPGRAITYFTQDDSVYLRSIANVMKQAGCPVPDYMLQLARPSKKRRKKLAHTAPKRKPVSTDSQYDLEQRQKQKEENMKSVYKKKPRPNKESSTPGGEKTGPVTKSQPNKKSKKKNFLKGDAEQASGTSQEVSEVGQNKEGDHTSGKISSSKSVKHKGEKNRNNKKMKKKTNTSVK